MRRRSRKLALVLLVMLPDAERPMIEQLQPQPETMADVQRTFWQGVLADLTVPSDAGAREVAEARNDAEVEPIESEQGAPADEGGGVPLALEDAGDAASDAAEEDADAEAADAGAADAEAADAELVEADAGDAGEEGDGGPDAGRTWPPAPLPSPVVDGRIDGFATSIGIGEQSTGTGIGPGSTGDGIGPRTGTQGFGTGQGMGPRSTGTGSGMGHTGDGIGPNTGTQGFGTGISIGEERQGTQGFGTSIGIGPRTGNQGFGTGIGIGPGTTGYGLRRPWGDAGAP